MRAPPHHSKILPRAHKQQVEAPQLLQVPAPAQTKAPPKVDKRLAQASAAASAAPADAAAVAAAGGAKTKPSSTGSKASDTARPAAARLQPAAGAAQPASATTVSAGVPSGVGPSAASMEKVVADAHADSQRVSGVVSQ